MGFVPFKLKDPLSPKCGDSWAAANSNKEGELQKKNIKSFTLEELQLPHITTMKIDSAPLLQNCTMEIDQK